MYFRLNVRLAACNTNRNMSRHTHVIICHLSVFQQLLLKKAINTQLLSLINNVPKPEVNVKIEFVTDAEKFEQAIKANFGTFKRVEEKEASCEVTLPVLATCHLP